MISFDQAYQLVMAQKLDMMSESISILDGMGRCLDESWIADRDMPPYDRVAMDGIAINFEGIKTVNTHVLIEGTAAAGSPQMVLNDEAKCLEVMTGAVLPKGTDTVIRYEDLEINGDQCRILEPFNKGQNIHRRATDRKKGDQLIEKGTVLSPAEIGVGASIGQHKISVKKRPRILIVSTGDELVEIDESPQPHQIRKSNVHRIAAALLAIGIHAEALHVDDDYDEIIQTLKGVVASFDVLILSGGVSKGKFDYIPDALQELGVKKHFHQVAQRPGKPFWFGHHESGMVVFALPGNPVSSFMCTCVYVIPWLQHRVNGKPQNRFYAILQDTVEFKPELTYFLPVKLIPDQSGYLQAHPRKGGGSGDLVNLIHADGFLQLPPNKTTFGKGESYPVFIYRRLD